MPHGQTVGQYKDRGVMVMPDKAMCSMAVWVEVDLTVRSNRRETPWIAGRRRRLVT